MTLGRRAALGLLTGAVAGVVVRPAWSTPRDPLSALWGGIELQGPDGRTFGVRDGAAARLVHLWAHWCPACLGEMNAVAATAALLKVELVLVSHPEFWAKDQAFARRLAWPYRLAAPSAANPPAVLDAALLEGSGAYTVPRSLLFAAARPDVVWSHTGALPWSAPDTLARLRAALTR